MNIDLFINWWDVSGAMVVVPRGVITPAGFDAIRETVMSIASEEPRAVIVDIDRLQDDDGTSRASFTALGRDLDVWPGVPLLLVASGDAWHRALASHTSTPSVTVRRTTEAAIGAIGVPLPRKVARLLLPNGVASLPLARQFIRDCCQQWGVDAHRAADATWIANEFVEKTLRQTCGPPTIRFERLADLVTVSVFDENPGLFERPPTAPGESGDETHGLSVISDVCRACGLVRTPTGGKVVWAAI